MKKLLLGLVLSGVAVTSLAATKVNAEENFSYKQDFNYTEDVINRNNYNIIAPTDVSKLALVDDVNEDYIRYSYATNDSTGLLRFRGNSSTPLYDDTADTVLKTRFRISSLSSGLNLKTWFGSNTNVGGGTYTWLGFGSDGTVTANPGGGLTVSGITPEVNKWYEFTLVIDNNDGVGTDVYYGYLDGKLIYTKTSNAAHDYIGKFYELQFEVPSNNSEGTIDLDYMYFGEYNGGVATAPAAKTVTVGDQFDLVPSVTPNDSNYDLSIDDSWTPSFDKEDVLTYDTENNKFEAVGPGTVDVTFNFNDPMIEAVKTTVTVEAGAQEILVEGIELKEFENNTITLVKGETYDLNKLFRVTNPAATDKTLDYVKDSSGKYTLEGSTLTAVALGEGNLVVNSHDAGDATLSVKVKVVDGAYIGTPQVGTKFDEAGATATNNGINYQTGSYNNRPYSKVSVVEDDTFGPTYAFEGQAQAASNVLAWIDGSKLTENKNYVLTAYAKLSGNVSGSPRVDLKIDGYKLTENEEGQVGYSYNSLLHEEIRVEMKSNTNPNGLVAEQWCKIEAPLINFDASRVEGLKIELVSWNTANGMTTYVTHPQLVVTDEEAPLKGVEVTCGEVTLSNVEANAPETTLTAAGANAQINTLPVPSVAELGTVTYESTKPEVATVDATGKITAVANGETVIKVTANNSTYYLKVTVAIEKHIESIEIEDENVTLTTDDKTFNVSLTLNPVDYTSTINVVAADPTIVSVSNASIVGGKLYITPLKAGTTTITLTSEDNPEVKLTINVTVTEKATEPEEPENKPCTGITLDKTSVTLNVGDTHTIKATLTPNDTTDKVTYTSSDANVVNVDATGKVTAKAKGTATITVKCGDKEATLTVTVNEAPVTSPDDNSNAGLIWGIVGGVLAAVVIAGVVTFVVLKKKRSNK